MRLIFSVLRDVVDVTPASRKDIGLTICLLIGLLILFLVPGYPAEAAELDPSPIVTFVANLDPEHPFAGYQSKKLIAINEEIWSSNGPVVPLWVVDNAAKSYVFNRIPNEAGDFVSYRLHLNHMYDPMVGIGWVQQGCPKGPYVTWMMTETGYQVEVINTTQQVLYVTGDNGDNWQQLLPGSNRWVSNFTDWGHVEVRPQPNFLNVGCADLYWLLPKTRS